MEGYGVQYRLTKPVRLTMRETLPPYTVTTAPSKAFRQDQQTFSFRRNVAGTPLLESSIDPYRSLLIDTSGPKWDKSGDSTVPIDDGTVYSIGVRAKSHPPQRDNGHAFITRKRTCESSLRDVYFWNGLPRQYFAKQMIAAGAHIAPAAQSKALFVYEGNSYAFGRLDKISPQSDLANYGKRAINYLAPGYPEVSLFAGIGELLAAFPKLLGHTVLNAVGGRRFSFTGVASAVPPAGEEFLNFVFGTNPTFKDLQKVVESMRTATDALIFLSENSGAGVRRNMTFNIPSRVAVFDTSELDYQGDISALTDTSRWILPSTPTYDAAVGYATGTFTSSLSQLESRQVRFSGSFTRFLPVDRGLYGSSQRFLAAFDAILGVKPNFQRVWQLIPFSWLVDWFLDIQSTLTLLDRTFDDSLLINYGYVTGSLKRTSIQETTVVPVPGRVHSFRTARTVVTAEIKQRIRANPYGFIVPDSTEITPLRLAILAAIGITRRSAN